MGKHQFKPCPAGRKSTCEEFCLGERVVDSTRKWHFSLRPVLPPPYIYTGEDGKEGGRHIYIYWQMLTHSFVLANAAIHSLSFRDFLSYRRDGNMCQHPIEQLKGLRTSVTFCIPSPLLW